MWFARTFGPYAIADTSNLWCQRLQHTRIALPQSTHSTATEHAWRCYRALLHSMVIIVVHRNRVCSTCLSHKNCYRAFASSGQGTALEHTCNVLVPRTLVIWIPNSSVSTCALRQKMSYAGRMYQGPPSLGQMVRANRLSHIVPRAHSIKPRPTAWSSLVQPRVTLE